MRVFISFLLIFSICTGTVFSQDSAIDGKEWNNLSRQQRMSYVLGMYDGMELMTGTWGIKSGNHLITELTPAELIDKLDTFYSDAKNTNVPILKVISLFAKEI